MSSISDFTYSDSYTTMLGAITNDATAFKINNSIVKAEGNVVTDVFSSAKNITSEALNLPGAAIMEVVDYVSPTTLALNSMYSIGKEFDDMIKDNLAIQTMHIKGSDILCSIFCIVVSMLDCSTRKELHEAITRTQKSLTAAAQMTAAANELVKTANATMVGAEAVALSATNLFSKNAIANTFGQQESGVSGVMGIATIKAASKSVDGIVETFERGLSVLNYGRITRPINVTQPIWDLAKSTLYALQSQAMQYADKALNEVIDPIEEKITEWVPSECGTRGYAWRFFQKVLSGITREKHWIMQLIADLFASGNDFSDKMGNFQQGSIDLLELRAFLDALKMISHRFGDLAIACGVMPCSSDGLTEGGKRIADAIKSGHVTTAPIGSPSTISSIPTKSTSNLDEISSSIANMLDLDNDNVLASKDSLSFVYTVASNPPKKIQELIDLNGLGPDYSVFNDGKDIKVVHTFKRMCDGE